MTNFNLNTFRDQPDEAGRFGIHGGRFVAETLMPLILDVEKAYNEARIDKSLLSEMTHYQKHYIGRPSPLFLAEITAYFGGAKLYLKRDELNHTGAHKITNVWSGACQTHGQNQNHCRNRRWSAWRCHSNSLCTFHGMRSLYAEDVERQSQS